MGRELAGGRLMESHLEVDRWRVVGGQELGRVVQRSGDGGERCPEVR